MNPLLAPLWLGGLAFLLLGHLRSARFVGWAFVGIFVGLLLLRAKNYYVAPAYPVLFAAGAVALEEWTVAARQWVGSAYVAATLAAGLVLAPFALPVLPVDTFVAYQTFCGGFQPVRFERHAAERLPQHFADEFGWEEMVRETARVYHALPAAQRQGTALFANDYGEAAAIDFFGPKYGLPAAISNHVTYWLWGPRRYTGESVLVLGSDGAGDREHFRIVEAVGRVDDPRSRRDEQFELYLCRDLNQNLRDFWPGIRKW